MKAETRLRKKFLDSWSGFVSRVEPSVGSDNGHPDVLLACLEIPDALVEFKVLDDLEFSMRRSQHFWHTDYIVSGGTRAFWALLDEHGCYIIRSDRIMAAAGSTTRVLLSDASQPSLIASYRPWEDTTNDSIIARLRP